MTGSGKTTLAKQLAPALEAVRMCPDEWMMAAGIDLWDERTRALIEAFQFDLTMELLAHGTNVVVEWGVWSRSERDALRVAARTLGSSVELRHTTAPVDELWRRIQERNAEAMWCSRPIERSDLDGWILLFEPPTEGEFSTYDLPLLIVDGQGAG
jgi:predicted kinase